MLIIIIIIIIIIINNHIGRVVTIQYFGKHI